MTANNKPVQNDARARRLIFFTLAAGIFAGAASIRILDALLPTIAGFYGQSIGHAGFAVTAYSGSYSICQLLYGPLGDRLGPYRVVTFAAICSGIAALGCSLAPTIDWLIFLRFLAGGVAAAIGPLAITWISHATTLEDRPAVLANATGASIIGATAGQIGGGLIGEVLNWQASFIPVALLFVVTGVALVRAGARHPHYRLLGSKPAGEHRSSYAMFSMLLSTPAVRVTLMAVGIEGLATYMSFTYVSALLHQRLALGVAAIGLLIAFFGLGGIAFVLAARAVVRTVSESHRAVSGGCLMGTGFLLLAVVNSPVGAGFALFVLGAGFFLFHNILQVRATTMAPSSPGAAISLFSATFFASQAIGALIGGWLFDHLGASVCCVASAVMLMGLSVAISWKARSESAH
ncbi:MAG: MFS transporter [Sphingobium sp.]